VKAIGGRHFDWDTRTNVFPFTRLPRVVGFADAHGIDVAPEIRALVPAASQQAEQEVARPDVYTDRAGKVVISTGYDPRLNLDPPKNCGRSFPDRSLPEEVSQVFAGVGVSPPASCAACP